MDVDKSLLLKSSQLQLLVDSLLLESSAELPPDILHTDPHPSDLSLVLLAAEVYTEKVSEETDEDYGEYLDLPKGWRLLATGSNSGGTNGYFGAAFVDSKSQQVVVAHRGTIPTDTGALLTDVLGICGTKYTSCMNSAITFVDQMRQVIHSVNTQHGRSYNLTITGHSLGGWLAQVTVFTVKWLNASDGVLKKNTTSSSGLHAKAVVFDSPGAKDMLNKMWDDYYYRHRTDVLDWLNIIVYVSAPNRVNTCGAHIGRVYRILFDASSYSWKDNKTVCYNVKTHEINNFTNAFKQKSPNISEVLDWAKDRAEFSHLFGNQALNPVNNYHSDFTELINKLNIIKKRYKVIPVEPRSDAKIKATIHFDTFSEDEFQVLTQLMIIQKNQRNYDILSKLVLIKNLKLDEGDLFPHFEINHNNRTIICQSKQQLGKVCARVKQLMRWLGTEFSKAVEEQSRHADLIYRDEGQTYLNSLPKTSLNFNDSLGLQEFLLSPTDRILWIDSKGGEFEMIRLYNIFCQIKENISPLRNQYTGDSHYIFLDWPRLQKLYKNYGSPIHQNNLMMVDASLTASSGVHTFLNDYIQCSPHNLKKLVFISSEPREDTFNYFGREVKVLQKINIIDLSTESQNIVLQRKLISSGNRKYSFQEFLGNNFSILEINQLLCSDIFKTIATNEVYVSTLKDTRPTITDLQMALIKTNINVTSKEHVLNCVDLPNSLVVMSGLNRGDLETGACWEQLQGKEILLAEGDAEQFFKETCDENQDKTIYLLEVSGDAKAEIRCKKIFDRAFYVSRKFRHRASINLQKFAESKHADDLFIILCEEHKTLLLEMTKDCKERDAFKENVLIANTEEQEVDIIHKYSHKNIHFMKVDETDERNERVEKYPSGEVEWRFSQGSTEGVRPFMTTELEPIDELSLSKTERNLVVITDEPGMGKTTSLARLSRLLEAPWVIYMEFKLFKKHIDNLSDQLTPQNVATFLLSASGSDSDSTPNLAEGLLLYFLNSKACSKRVVLMFDGFDEIDDYIKNKDSSKDKIVKLLTFLQSKPSIQIFLTARQYLKKSLETNLGQLSTSFVTLTAQEQLDFLFTLWRSFLPLELGEYRGEEERRLKKYAGEVLRQAEEVLRRDTKCIMGVPLQLRMLAEVFRPTSDQLLRSPEVLLEQINVESISNLYKKFITLKYEIYLNDKTTLGAAADDLIIKLVSESINTMHCKLGFKTFFHTFYVKHFDAIEDRWLSKLNRIGLVQTKEDGDFQFIHRTFAEYCCAEMVVHWFNRPRSFNRYDLFKEIIIPQILLHPDSKIIRMFLNELLNVTTMSETTLQLNAECISRLWNEDSSIFSNQKHQNVLHIAVLENNVYIATMLLRGLQIESAQEAFVSLIIQYDRNHNTAINYINKPKLHIVNKNELVSDKMTTNIFQRIEVCSDENKANIFFAILFNRKVSKSDETAEKFFFERFFNRQGIKASRSTEEEPIVIINLFYRVINNYISFSSRIFDRVEQIELLIEPFIKAVCKNKVKRVKKIIFEKLNNVERYCFLLMKHKDQEMRTVLHIAIAARHLDIVGILGEQTAVPFTVLMAQRDEGEMTPLYSAAEWGGLDITKYLVERGADISTCDAGGRSVLMYAALGGELLTVKYLVERGGDIHATDRDGHTVLHDAARRGHLPVVEHFLQQGVDPDRVDREGWTALTEASRYEKWDVVRLLLERGVNVNADGGRALSYAIMWGEWSIVEALINKGAAIEERLIGENLSKFKVKYPNYEFKKE